MYFEHPAFQLPEPSTKIMRYMSYAKFADLLHRNSLYFAPFSSLDDKYEGTLPQPMADVGLLAGIPNLADDNRQTWEGHLLTYRKQVRDQVRICSWCMSEYESISMWDRYAATDGLAISSDVGSLMASFIGDQNVRISIVHYIDYTSEILRMLPDGLYNLFHPSIHKRREYSDEKEIRAVVEAPKDSSDDPSLNYQPVELESLLKGVTVSPEAGDWLIELIESDLQRVGISVPVERSLLSRVPLNY